MPLKVIRRKGRNDALTISGTIRFADGHAERVVRRASTNDPRLASEEAAALEAQLLRNDWHGERKGSRSFAEAMLAYFEAEPRTEGTKARYRRVLKAVGDVPLSTIDQDTVTAVARSIIRPGSKPCTVTREVLNPIRAVVNLAVRRRWAEPVEFTVPKESEGRTIYLTPDQAERLLAAASPHLRPLLTFLLGTGARVSEALELEWRDVDLLGGRAILWRTKGGRRRDVELPQRVVDALQPVTARPGPVFLKPDGRPYGDHERRSGGQFKTAFKGAVRRAGLDPAITPHTLRHTWATWSYALHKDPIRLKQEGAWSDLKLVERYAHLMPAGHEDAIRRFLGLCDRGATVDYRTPPLPS